ncbi:MAG: FAD-dependent oxidoreductase [Oscillospiraceae bacterium]|nr:FAD-dependent oxidoreductase [Oscillospiraceae bacterium]
MKYPNLFKPIMIGNTLFKNRIFSAPTGHPDSVLGRLSDDVVSYFERKAQGGAAAVTLGEAVVDSVYGKGYPQELSLDSRQPGQGLANVADKISRHGAIPSIELQHAGLKARPGVDTLGVCNGSKIIYGPSACVYEGNEVQEMPEDLIWEIIEKYANAARFVQGCGFGMVTVHAGHGWLINQFMCERTNRRTDKWGGSVENRARFAVEVCDAIHKKCGAGFPVEVRISAAEGINGGYTAEDGAAFAMQLEGHANIIHCSAGCGVLNPERYRTFSITHPCMFKEDGVNVKYAAEVRKHIKNTPVATVGALSDPAMMEDIIASGKADIVEMARGLICDPDLPNKARDGRDDEIVKCMRCFTCFSNGMQRGPFWCALNPETNRERSVARDSTRPVTPKKVLVVGGGIGGMQAALTAEKNGHDVILCEKSDRLGGHIRCEEKVPFKKHLAEYLAQQERKVMNSSIDLRLNTSVTPEYAKEIGADVVIAALGARPIKPVIEGIDGDNVMLADDAYLLPEKVGENAVILGGGLVGLELAIYLHSLGKHVDVVEMADGFIPGSNMLHVQAIEIKMREEDFLPHFSTKAKKIDTTGVLCDTPDGEKHFDADTVIYAVGQKSLSEEAMALYDCAGRFYPIGDCVVPANISEANKAGYSVANDIGRF